MTIVILERVPARLRGALTRWLLEPKTGVFVGRVSALVREKLWEMVAEESAEQGAALLIYQANTEQGFALRSLGETRHMLRDYEGLVLLCVKEG